MNHLNGKNEEDRRIYERSARLILLLALRDIAPGAKARFEHSIGLGLYLNVSGVSLTASLVRKIEARMREISKADLPIVKSRWTREQAVAYFRAQGQEDTVRLLAFRSFRRVYLRRPERVFLRRHGGIDGRNPILRAAVLLPRHGAPAARRGA